MGNKRGSDWLYWRWSLARLLEERVLELNLYIGIGICQMAKEVKGVPGRGSGIDKGMEMREPGLFLKPHICFSKPRAQVKVGSCQKWDQGRVSRRQILGGAGAGGWVVVVPIHQLRSLNLIL